MSNMIKPTKQQAEAMQKYGIEMVKNADGSVNLKGTMDNLRTSLGGLDETQQAAAASTIFGKEAMSGALAIVNATDKDYQSLTKATTDYDGAAKDMAETMEGNLKGALNNIKSALEEAALKIYDAMLPALESLAEKIQSAVDWFNNLDQGTQENIVKMGLFVGAIGPVLLVVGALAGSISKIVGVAKLASGALGLMGTGATAAAGVGTTTGIAGLGGAITTGAAAFLPWVAGAGAVAGAAYVIAQELKEEAIPAVDLFGEGVSENTEKAVGDFLELENQATTSLRQLAWTGGEVTEEMKESIGGNFAAMKDTVVNELDEQKQESIDILTKLFSESETITKEELAKDLKRVEKNYEDKKAKTEEGNRRIQQILETARKEKRELKESEVKEIETLNEVMKKDAVRILSASEEEQLTILRRLELESGNISARQAAEIVQNSKKAKDGAIREAEEQYNEALRYARQLRQEGGAENEAMADKVEKEALRQKNAAVVNAGKMHQEVVSHAKQQASEHVNQIDWESGQLMTKWGQLKSWFANNPIVRKIQEIRETVSSTPSQYDYTPRNNAHGTEYFNDDWTWVGEQGRELIKPPKGSKILSNPKSEKLASQGKGITQNITINSPTPLTPSEIARKNLQVSRQLAAEWGV